MQFVSLSPLGVMMVVFEIMLLLQHALDGSASRQGVFNSLKGKAYESVKDTKDGIRTMLDQYIYNVKTKMYDHQPPLHPFSFKDFHFEKEKEEFDKDASIIEPYLTYSTTPNPPPLCINNESELVYVNGILSVSQTFYSCLANIGDPMFLPTIYNGTVNGIVHVYSSIQMNNLHEINAIDGTATFDFYLRLYWQDNRFAMPLLWNRLSKKYQQNGIEITLIGTNSSILLWTPDIQFNDVTDLQLIAQVTVFLTNNYDSVYSLVPVQTARFNSSNIFFWSRHFIGTFTQPKLDFSLYPADLQTINLRFGSYAYDLTWLQMNFTSTSPLTFNENYDGSYSLFENPSWEFVNSSSSYARYVSNNGFLNIIYHLPFQRKGSGIVLRLILPITLLCLLGGLTFWASHEARVDTTITLLLAVSALYIVILANIPLVGYLTNMDTYIFWMFLLLAFAVILHQIYCSVEAKKEKWPLRVFYLRLLEAVGRICIFPIVIALFLSLIQDVDASIFYGMIIILILSTTYIFCREIIDLRGNFQKAMRSLLEKLNEEEIRLKELSTLEIAFFNYWEFRIFSSSPEPIAAFLLQKGKIAYPESRSIHLRKVGVPEVLTSEELAYTFYATQFSKEHKDHHLHDQHDPSVRRSSSIGEQYSFKSSLEFSDENPQLQSSQEKHKNTEFKRVEMAEFTSEGNSATDEVSGKNSAHESRRGSLVSLALPSSTSVDNTGITKRHFRRLDSDDDYL